MVHELTKRLRRGAGALRYSVAQRTLPGKLAIDSVITHYARQVILQVLPSSRPTPCDRSGWTQFSPDYLQKGATPTSTYRGRSELSALGSSLVGLSALGS